MRPAPPEYVCSRHTAEEAANSLLPLQGVLVPEAVLEKRGGHPPQSPESKIAHNFEYTKCRWFPQKPTVLKGRCPLHVGLPAEEPSWDSENDILLYAPSLAGSRFLAPATIASTYESCKKSTKEKIAHYSKPQIRALSLRQNKDHRTVDRNRSAYPSKKLNRQRNQVSPATCACSAAGTGAPRGHSAGRRGRSAGRRGRSAGPRARGPSRASQHASRRKAECGW